MPRCAFRHVLALTVALFAAWSARAMSVVPPTFDELVGEADTVIRGQVTSVRSAYDEASPGRPIRTYVSFRVERTLKGAPTATDTLTLVLLGGTVGAETLEVAGMPTFRVGDREIVFVANNGRTYCPLIAAGHGRYRVLHDPATDRDYIARENRLPLESTEEVSLPLEMSAAAARLKSPARALTPAAFESSVEKTAARLAPALTTSRN